MGRNWSRSFRLSACVTRKWSVVLLLFFRSDGRHTIDLKGLLTGINRKCSAQYGSSQVSQEKTLATSTAVSGYHGRQRRVTFQATDRHLAQLHRISTRTDGGLEASSGQYRTPTPGDSLSETKTAPGGRRPRGVLSQGGHLILIEKHNLCVQNA